MRSVFCTVCIKRQPFCFTDFIIFIRAEGLISLPEFVFLSAFLIPAYSLSVLQVFLQAFCLKIFRNADFF